MLASRSENPDSRLVSFRADRHVDQALTLIYFSCTRDGPGANVTNGDSVCRNQRSLHY